jgi:basic amino acid/polyamine antiporter, APA family
MSSASKESASNQQGQLGLWDAISIIVGIVIGTTIYKVPWLIFSNTANPTWGLMVWVIGGLIALIGAFCYAELATTYPKAGGDYYYLSRGFGPGTGFLFGWAQLTVVMPASIGAMAYVFADFFQKAFFPNQVLEFKVPIGAHEYIFDPYFAIAAIAVLAVAFTNILGVFLGKLVQNLLTFAKILGLGALIICGLCWYEPGAWDPVPTVTTPPQTAPAYLGTLAIILVMYAYGGWNDSAFVAAEMRNPKRNIPRALFLGIGIIVLVYILVNAAYINHIGWENIRNYNPGTDAPLPTQVIAGSPLSEWGGLGMSLIVMVSALGAVNGLTFTGARVYATLGSEHRLFGWMGHWRPGRGAPIMALLVQALLTLFIVAAITTQQGHTAINDALGYVNVGLAKATDAVQVVDENRWIPPIDVDSKWRSGDGFEKLVDHTAPVFWLFFLATGLSLFLLREKNPTVPRPYSVPWYPVVPLLFIYSCAWMLYQATDYVKWRCLFALVMVLLGLPLYWLSCLIGKPTTDEPADLGLTPVKAQPAEKRWR